MSQRRQRPTADAADEETDSETVWAEFVSFLRAKRARVTDTRRWALETALARRDHFRADDLAAQLASGRRRVSRGTVYRTLSLMVEAGLLRAIRDGDAHVHYERVSGHPHHEHMVCDRCGRFIEFDDIAAGEDIRRACERLRFRQRTHRIVVFGTCEDCVVETPQPRKEKLHG